jgi:hypothetical protein
MLSYPDRRGARAAVGCRSSGYFGAIVPEPSGYVQSQCKPVSQTQRATSPLGPLYEQLALSSWPKGISGMMPLRPSHRSVADKTPIVPERAVGTHSYFREIAHEPIQWDKMCDV